MTTERPIKELEEERDDLAKSYVETFARRFGWTPEDGEAEAWLSEQVKAREEAP